MYDALILSCITASISFTFAETKICEPLRKWLQKRTRFFGQLFSCGYCLGHWMAFGLVALYQPRVVHGWAPLDYVLTALIVAWLAAFQWIAMCWLMKQGSK